MSAAVASNGNGNSSGDLSANSGKSDKQNVQKHPLTSNVHPGSSSSVDLLNQNANARKDTLLTKLGGKVTLRTAVDKFYERLAVDPFLQPFFRGTNIQLLKWHQFNFMSVAFANVPEELDMANLVLNKHRWLFDMGMSEKHYDAMMQHFVETLIDIKIEQELVDEALFMLSPMRPIFVQGAILAQSRRQAKRRMHNLQVTALVAVVAIGVFRLYRNMNRK